MFEIKTSNFKSNTAEKKINPWCLTLSIRSSMNSTISFTKFPWPYQYLCKLTKNI